MRLIDDSPTPATMAHAPARNLAATADPDTELGHTAADGSSTPTELASALAAARELLARTVEAVNPGTPRCDLFAHVTQYRARLAGLVAACQATASGDGA